MTDLAKLVVRLEAETGRYQRNLEGAQRQLAQFATRSEASGKRVERSLDSMARRAQTVSRAMTALAAAAATAMPVIFIRRVTAATDEMIKFGHRLGLTAEEMRRLQFMSDRTGTNINSFASAMQRLTRNLADARDGAGPAADAIRRLQLSPAELLSMGQDRAFVQIAERLKNVTDRGTQTQLAFQLLGREGQALLGMINRSGDQFGQMADDFDRLNLALSERQAGNIEALSDAIGDAATVSSMFSQRVVAEMAPAIQVLVDRFVLAKARTGELGDSADDLAAKLVKGIAFSMDAFAGFGRTVEVGGHLVATSFAMMNEGAWMLADALVNGPTEAMNALIRQANRLPMIEIGEVGLIQGFGTGIREQYQQANAVVREGQAALKELLMKPLPGAQFLQQFEEARARINQVRAGGASDDDGVLGAAGESEKFAEQVAKMIAQLEQQIATYEKGAVATMRYRIEQGDLAETFAALGPNAETLKDEVLRLAGSYEKLEEQSKAAAETQRELEALMKDGARVTESVRTPLEKFNDEVERLNKLRATFVDGQPLINEETYTRGVAAAQKALDDSSKNAQIWGASMDELARSAARNIQGALADFLFDPFEDGLNGMLSGFTNILQRMAAEAAATQILGAVANSAFGGAMAGVFGGAPKPAANGARAVRNRVYEVGELGREWFVPDSSGEIVTESDMAGRLANPLPEGGGAPNVQINVTNQSSTPIESRNMGVRATPDGFVLDVLIRDLNEGGPYSRAHERKYGMQGRGAY